MFSSYADEYLEGYSKLNKRPTTYRRDGILIKHLKGYFANRRMSEITPEMIEMYKEKRLEAGRAPATVNREVACLKHMFNVAIRNSHATSNPVISVKLLRENNVITRVLSKADEEKLLAAAQSPHIRAIIICALETGMRVGELLDLRGDQIDFRTGIILVAHTKSGRSREIPVNQRLRETLKELADRGLGQRVFWWKDGEPLGSVKKGYKAALRRAGLEEKRNRFHDLRHTFATRLIDSGVDPFTVQELLGNASITTTQRYAHPNLESKRRAVARLSEDI